MLSLVISMLITAHAPAAPALRCHHVLRHAHSISCSGPSFGTPKRMLSSSWARQVIFMAVNDLKVESEIEQREEAAPSRKGQRRQADSTDWIASNLTRRSDIQGRCHPKWPFAIPPGKSAPQHAFMRRFGLAGGLIWLGILTFGVVSEQIKTRLEASAERRDTRVGPAHPIASALQMVKAI